MNARLQGFLGFLDLLAEGQQRQADSIAGRSFRLEPELMLQSAVPAARVLKFPLTGHQKAHSLRSSGNAKVTTFN